jgi:hypothetical protein
VGTDCARAEVANTLNAANMIANHLTQCRGMHLSRIKIPCENYDAEIRTQKYPQRRFPA